MDLVPGNYLKAIIGSAATLIVVLFLLIVKLITGSFIVGIILLLVLIYFVLKAVGSFIMYPGSFFLTRSDIEIRMSREISARMVTFFNSTHFLHLCVAQKKYVGHQNHFDFQAVITNHIILMKEMLALFEQTLSQRKRKMLDIYRHIEELIDEKEEDEPCISDFIRKPRTIDTLDDNLSLKLREKFEKIETLLKELHSIIKSYSPPTSTFSLIKFRAFEENLYQIRFGFHTWKRVFNYQLQLINTSNNDQIETIVIHNLLKHAFFMIDEPQKQVDPSKPTVLFCNPNGVFIQFFGFDNEYIRNYLKQGFNVIMWNYRGYAQSTGTPSIAKSQQDVFNVYNHYRQKGYNIKIVHGYSIGGAAAVGLFGQISQQEQQNIQVLIVDRSFSSIGEMSIQFGPALHRIAKLIFIGDNIDLSKQFQSVKCCKLLIWDSDDEVIPDRASVKNRIIKRKKKASGSLSMYEFDEDNEVNQLNEDNPPNPDFETITQKFAYTLRKLLPRMNIYSTKMDYRTKGHIDDDSLSGSITTSETENDNLKQLTDLLNKIDGGGLQILQDPKQLLEMLERRPDRFYHKCESYVLGLVCYGSYFPLRPIIHDHQQIKQQTLLKLEKAMGHLVEKYSIDCSQPQLMFKKEDSPIQLVSNVYHVYYKLSQMISVYFSEEWFALHGSLLPTNNGHNSGLSEQELNIMNGFIRTCLTHQQLQEEKIV